MSLLRRLFNSTHKPKQIATDLYHVTIQPANRNMFCSTYHTRKQPDGWRSL